MVDFVSEVQEELRKDDYNRWLKKYGAYLVGLIAAVIITAGYLEWKKANADKAARATSAAYIAAAQKADAGEVDQALREFQAIADVAPKGYAGLSLMRAAELELGQGNVTAAIAHLDQAAATFENARHSQLAQIKAAYILAGESRYDDVSLRVAPLAEKDEPYEYLARELLGFAAKQNGDVSRAREQFSYLERIPGVPSSIQQRAELYLSLMSTSAIGAEDTPKDVILDAPIDETETPDIPTEAETVNEE